MHSDRGLMSASPICRDLTGQTKLPKQQSSQQVNVAQALSHRLPHWTNRVAPFRWQLLWLFLLALPRRVAHNYHYVRRYTT